MSYIRYPHLITILAGAVAALCAVTPAMAGCQSGSSDNGSTTMRLDTAGCQAKAPGIGALAVGDQASATNDFATAVGRGASATVPHGSGFGTSARANGENSTAVGSAAAYHSPANTAPGYIALGAFAGTEHRLGPYSTTIGSGTLSDIAVRPRALGAYAIAIGGSNDVNAIGAQANGYRSIAIGQRSTTGDGSGFTGFGLGDFGTSVGFNTHTAFAATSVGTDAQAKGDSSTALGRFANASATSSVALGHGAVANKPRSVAIGSGSLANAVDTVSVGTNTARRRIVNVASATANSDAATLGQVKAIATAAAQTALLSVNDTTDLRRELADLRATVRRQEHLVQKQQELLSQQQQELAALKSQRSAALEE